MLTKYFNASLFKISKLALSAKSSSTARCCPNASLENKTLSFVKNVAIESGQ